MRNACVIVPTFDREELLYLCLEHIRTANQNIPIHVFPDRGTDNRTVCAAFDGVFHHLTIQHTYFGNSFNMMEALKWAAMSPQRFDTVYVIEDDAFITSDFFKWADSALMASPNVFAACGWSFSPDAPPPCDGADTLIPWYLSVCAALPRHSLAAIVQHARPEYYSDMKHYLDAAYPSSPQRGTLHYEQDGLVLRVMQSQSRFCAWPKRPRAIHVGWFGYHMPTGQRLEGTLLERVRVTRLILDNPHLLKSLLAGGPRPQVAKCRVCAKTLLTTDPECACECIECFHSHSSLPIAAPTHYYFPMEA